MIKLKRINLDKVREAFVNAGINEISFGRMDKCVMAAFMHPKKLQTRQDAVDDGYDLNYVSGVMQGWDDSYYNCWCADENTLAYKLGLADGRAARKIMRLTKE